MATARPTGVPAFQSGVIGQQRVLKALQILRLRLHRLDPSRPLRSASGAAAFIRDRGIVMASGRASLPILTEAIAGRTIHGSWMADREASRIYAMMGRLLSNGQRGGEVLAAPLVLGKGTYLHAALAPAVERVASDPPRCKSARGHLPPLARRLMEDVERHGRVRMDRWDAPVKEAREARLRLERELLVASNELHTDKGYHTNTVIPWMASSLSRRFAKPAQALSIAEAQRQLLASAVRSAVVTSEREARRWFVFGGEEIDSLIHEGIVVRIVTERRAWLASSEFL